jgi:hypothetical protein
VRNMKAMGKQYESNMKAITAPYALMVTLAVLHPSVVLVKSRPRPSACGDSSKTMHAAYVGYMICVVFMLFTGTPSGAFQGNGTFVLGTFDGGRSRRILATIFAA